MKSVYIHIPFCLNICSYCDFCKMYYNEELVDRYLDVLKEEIKLNYKNEIIETIYIGGGTPSSLNLKQLSKLFEIIKIFKTNKNLEFTFECNIENIDKEKLILFKENNVNRLSIGIQTFNNKFLKYLNRFHTKEDVFKKIELAKNIGFNNINIDLIYGLKNQTIKDLEEDIDLFLKLDINHISTYSLIIEPHTKLYIEKENNIDEELDLEMYQLICKKLEENNFIHYEISNFAKNGYESKHNLTYWDNEEYYGFGLNASGFLENVRYENTRNLNKYLNDDVDRKQTILSKHDFMDNELMLGLRKLKGVNLKIFKEKYGVDLESVYPIKPLLKNKELIYKNGYIFINPSKLYLMNEILLKLI